MSAEITDWLNKDIQLSTKITDLQTQFQNGYLFGELFQKLGIVPEEKFSNKQDDQCVYQNYINAYETCEKQMGISITKPKSKAEKVLSLLSQIKKALSGSRTAKGLLKKNIDPKNSSDLSQSVQAKFQQTLAATDARLQKSFQNTDWVNRNISPKLMIIESQLQSFRDQRIKHEILAKQQKEEADQLDFKYKMEIRQIELTKTQKQHEYIKLKTKQIYDNWYKTQLVKKRRQQEDDRFHNFMTMNLKNRCVSERRFEQEEFKQGLDYFVNNCQRQGVELKHDPDKKSKKIDKAYFSIPATLLKIKERTAQAFKISKEKQKRKNKMMVDQLKQQKIIEEKKQVELLLEKYQNISRNQTDEGFQIFENIRKSEIIRQNMVGKSLRLEEERKKYLEASHLQHQEEERIINQKKKQAWKGQQLQYREENLNNKIRKRAKHTKVCKQLMMKILDMTELCYLKQQGSIHKQISELDEETRTRQLQILESEQTIEKLIVDLTIDEKDWISLQNRFVEDLPLSDEKVFSIFDNSKGNQQQALTHQLSSQQMIYQQQAQEELAEYYEATVNWMPLHHYAEQQYLNQPFINDILGDFLFKVVDLAYPQVALPPVPNDIPNYLPLKLSIIGRSFAGKKTLAQILKSKYGIEIVNPDSILKEAINYAFPPIEDEKDKKKQSKKEAKKPVQEEEKKENPELKQLGIEANECKQNKQPYSDELYVRCIAYKIKELFPPKTEEQILKEIEQAKQREEERQAQIKKEREELEKKKQAPPKKTGKEAKKGKEDTSAQQPQQSDPPQKTRDDLYKEALESKPFPYTSGFVLIGFPRTLNQSKLLEKALTGYISPEDRLNKEGEQKKEWISKLVHPSQKEEELVLKRSGLDLVIELKVDEEECLRRAKGRKIDPQTEIVYHMQDNPPPTDVKGLLERLKDIDNMEQVLQEIQQDSAAFDQNRDSIEQWFTQFGFNDQKLCSFYQNDGQRHKIEAFLEIDSILADLVQIKAKEFESLQLKHSGKNEEAKQELPEPEKKPNSNEAQPMDQENLVNISREKIEQLDQSKSQVEQDPNAQLGQEKQVDISQALRLLNPETIKNLLQMWEETQNNYTNDIIDILMKLYEHREIVNSRCVQLQNKFLSIIQKPDDKNLKILNFQENLNKFIEENPDMIKMANAKAELNKHLDTMYEGLWDALEQKKNEAIEERQQIVGSGWIENEMDYIVKQFFRLYQIEMNRVNEIYELFLFTMDTMLGKPMNGVREHVMLEPFKNMTEPAIESNKDSNQYPKIDILYQYFVNQVSISHDVLLDMRLKYQKRKKAKPSAEAEKFENELKSIESIYKNIIEYEKTNAVIRGLILKQNCISRVKELRALGHCLYNKLDDWIIFGIKRENDVVYDLTKQFRHHIAKSTQSSLTQLNTKDIAETYKIINNYTIIPKLIQPQERPQDNRFTVQNLKVMLDELLTITDPSGCIEQQFFMNLILRRKNSPQCKQLLPISIQSLSDQQVQALVTNLTSKKSEAFINYKELSIALMLLASRIPTAEDLQEYKQLLESTGAEGQLEQYQFIEVPAWFDDTEGDENLYEDYTIPRQKFIKQFLFDNYCEVENYILNIEQYILELEKLTHIQCDTFWNYLFGDYQLNIVKEQ